MPHKYQPAVFKRDPDLGCLTGWFVGAKFKIMFGSYSLAA